MNTERTPINTALPVSLEWAKEHLRVTHAAEDTLITSMIWTVAGEIEAQAGIALLSQTITHTTDEDPGQVITLPVGPVALDATATVTLISSDGTTTALASGYWLEGGRYPTLRFADTAPTERLRITYEAGHTATPADVGQAIVEQVARLYTERGGVFDKGQSLSPHTARIIARHRRVSV